ncbi:MAG: RluA family pseudouridine synthase [Dysgonamonadaceae bacterium]|jgi:23S rRNA pseudouridine1911/1915/1917 synthase|nr:RluA family pseudouridine synthase [Dysgonamonadaceae bacterium]
MEKFPFDTIDEIDGDKLNSDSDSTSINELYEHFRFTADRGQTPVRVDKFLVDRIENASRNRIQSATERGYVIVNGTPVRSNYKVKPCDTIQVVMDRPRHDFEVLPENIPLNIVYEDSCVMVVDKPSGMCVHPGHGNYNGTMLNALAWYMRDKEGFNVNDPRLGLVHRIDKDTSGLLAVAKTPDAKTSLGRQFFNKTTKRLYSALVWGNVKNSEGRIEASIGRNPKDRLQFTVFPDGEQGRNAATNYRVIERFGYTTLVECRLETGRTHQIRVHLKHIGHTLFNDSRYGGNEILKGENTVKYRQFISNCLEICPRQALHAGTLGFKHPITGEELFFESPLPNDMAMLIDKWKNSLRR